MYAAFLQFASPEIKVDIFTFWFLVVYAVTAKVKALLCRDSLETALFGKTITTPSLHGPVPPQNI